MVVLLALFISSFAFATEMQEAAVLLNACKLDKNYKSLTTDISKYLPKDCVQCQAAQTKNQNEFGAVAKLDKDMNTITKFFNEEQFAKKLNERRLRQALITLWGLEGSFGVGKDKAAALQQACKMIPYKAVPGILVTLGAKQLEWSCANPAFKSMVSGFYDEYKKMQKPKSIYTAQNIGELNKTITSLNAACTKQVSQAGELQKQFNSSNNSKPSAINPYYVPITAVSDNTRTTLKQDVYMKAAVEDFKSNKVLVKKELESILSKPASKLLISKSVLKEIGLEGVFDQSHPGHGGDDLIKAIEKRCATKFPLKTISLNPVVTPAGNILHDLKEKIIGDGSPSINCKSKEHIGELQKIICDDHQLEFNYSQYPSDVNQKVLDANPVVFADLIASDPAHALEYAQNTCAIAKSSQGDKKWDAFERKVINLGLAGGAAAAGIASFVFPPAAYVSLGLTAASLGTKYVQATSDQQKSLDQLMLSDVTKMGGGDVATQLEKVDEKAIEKYNEAAEVKHHVEVEAVVTVALVGVPAGYKFLTEGTKAAHSAHAVHQAAEVTHTALGTQVAGTEAIDVYRSVVPVSIAAVNLKETIKDASKPAVNSKNEIQLTNQEQEMSLQEILKKQLLKNPNESIFRVGLSNGDTLVVKKDPSNANNWIVTK
jgi:hypothetical protein